MLTRWMDAQQRTGHLKEQIDRTVSSYSRLSAAQQSYAAKNDLFLPCDNNVCRSGVLLTEVQSTLKSGSSIPHQPLMH